MPTKLTGTEASSETTSIVSSRTRRTLTPKLAALSSPSLIAVSAQALRANSGRAIMSTASVVQIFGQVALVRLPIVQKTTADNACSEARYCRKASKALKVKTSAMPISTTVCTVTPRICEMK